jgi:hypothetical protein
MDATAEMDEHRGDDGIWFGPTEPHGVVLVLFGTSKDDYCPLGRCVSQVLWFSDHRQAEAYRKGISDDRAPHLVNCHALPVEQKS